jgi:hypothetical protein
VEFVAYDYGSEHSDYETEGSLYERLGKFIQQHKKKSSKISKEEYIAKIEEFLAGMTPDDILKSMSYYEGGITCYLVKDTTIHFVDI